MLVSVSNNDSRAVIAPHGFNATLMTNDFLLFPHYAKTCWSSCWLFPSDTHVQSIQVCTGMTYPRRTQCTLKTFFPVSTYTLCYNLPLCYFFYFLPPFHLALIVLYRQCGSVGEISCLLPSVCSSSRIIKKTSL